MPSVLVRKVSEDALAAHRARAKAKGISLEAELRDLIEHAAPYSPRERLAVAKRLQALTPPVPRTDPVALLREDRTR